MGEYTILLEKLRFYSYIGVYDEERKNGNQFEVNLKATYNGDDPEDKLENTVSYVDLYKIISEEMSRPVQLLETVAFTIAKRIKDAFPKLEHVECRVTKLTPPIPGFIGHASVEYRI